MYFAVCWIYTDDSCDIPPHGQGSVFIVVGRLECNGGLHPPLFLHLENIHPPMSRTDKATENCDSHQQRRQPLSCRAFRTRICVMACAASRGSTDFQPAILFMLKFIIVDLSYLHIGGWILVICLYGGLNCLQSATR